MFMYEHDGKLLLNFQKDQLPLDNDFNADFKVLKIGNDPKVFVGDNEISADSSDVALIAAYAFVGTGRKAKRYTGTVSEDGTILFEIPAGTNVNDVKIDFDFSDAYSVSATGTFSADNQYKVTYRGEGDTEYTVQLSFINN